MGKPTARQHDLFRADELYQEWVSAGGVRCNTAGIAADAATSTFHGISDRFGHELELNGTECVSISATKDGQHVVIEEVADRGGESGSGEG